MDYMGELLRRQRDALTALLLGGGTAEKRNSEVGSGMEQERVAAVRSMETEEGLTRSAGTEETASAAQRYRVRQQQSGTAEPETKRWKVSERDAAGAGGTVWFPDGSFTGRDSWWLAGGSAVGESGVREVSRAIQRDARRYDGGFSIY